jgi:hypothetical protein
MGSSAITGISRSPTSMRNSAKCGHSRSAASHQCDFHSPCTSRERSRCTVAPSCSNTSGARNGCGTTQGCWPPTIGHHGHMSGAALDSHHRVIAVVARLGPVGGQDDHRPATQCSSSAPLGRLVECPTCSLTIGWHTSVMSVIPPSTGSSRARARSRCCGRTP